MIKLIAEWSNYIFIVMCVIYAISCFTVFLPSSAARQVSRMNRQEFFMFLFHFICYGVLYAVTKDNMVLILYVGQAAAFKLLIFIYQHVYPDCSRIMVNHMCFLMMIGFVMLTRIGLKEYAIKQCLIAGVFSLVVLVVPVFVKKAIWLRRLRWAYGVLGLAFLMSVKVIGRTINGSTNWIAVGPFSLQPMEFVKITYIFFIAAMLGKRPDFKRIMFTSIFCAAHVLVLIMENDLGGALLYFVVFVLMCYVATGRLVYLFGGGAAGVVAGWLAYHLRAHVRTRFSVWKNPFADPLGKGYQMTQSLFAIGAGGWFGKGLTQGTPNYIPVVASDFIFAGIVEELGAIFGICLILIYIGIFVHFLRIAMDVEDRFYKLIGYGFSVCFIFQVFLSVGGVIKFIPSTGVTLPLISYGGSSVISTLTIFGIMQGVFMIAYAEDQQKEYEEAGRAWFDETRDTGYMEGFREGYPEDPAVHPADDRAYRGDRRSYPDDGRSYPKDRRSYPEDRRPHPKDRRSYPEDRRPHPEDRRSYSEDRRAYPAGGVPYEDDRKTGKGKVHYYGAGAKTSPAASTSPYFTTPSRAERGGRLTTPSRTEKESKLSISNFGSKGTSARGEGGKPNGKKDKKRFWNNPSGL